MNEVDNPTISPLCGIRTRTEWWDEKPKINNGMLASSLKGNKRSNRGSIRKAPECFKQDTWFDFQADLSFKGGGGERRVHRPVPPSDAVFLFGNNCSENRPWLRMQSVLLLRNWTPSRLSIHRDTEVTYYRWQRRPLAK